MSILPSIPEPNIVTTTHGPQISRPPTVTDIFDYAKSPPSAEGLFIPAVYATYVDHAANAHPDDRSIHYTNLVRYATGALTLSDDQKTLTGSKMRMWRNIIGDITVGGGVFPLPDTADVFNDPIATRAITITLADTGQVTYQLHDLKSGAVTVLNATYNDAMFVATGVAGMRSLSFTLGNR